MKHKLGTHPGATWRKTDFQIHTPRDPNWSGSPHLPAITEEEIEARRQWSRNFVSQCLQRNLTAIAVTDHHDVAFVPYIRAAILELGKEEEIWLFPGMEITLNDSAQCLVLFDRDMTDGDFRRTFAGMPKVAAPNESSATAPQAVVCGKELSDIINFFLAGC